MKAPFDIVVVGAGLSGLAAAALLAAGDTAGRLRLTIVDAGSRPAPASSGETGLRVSSISAGSAEMLREIGAWPSDERRLCPYDKMRVWDEADNPDSPTALVFDAADFAVPYLGYIVENALLLDVLLRRLVQAPVELRFDSPFKTISASGHRSRVELENGVTLEADLVVAADGAHSRVRECARIEVSRHVYGQSAFVTHLETSRPHCSTAWQRFLRDGPIGMLPLADGRISVVWSTTPETAQWASEAGDAELGERLTEATDSALGELFVAGRRGVFPLHAQHAGEYVRHGIALVGDAAHTIHPLAGQGANLGLADAARLARVVHEALEKGEYPADRPVLRRYERSRRGENAAMLHFMTGLNRLFAADSDVLGELRKVGMALFNRSGPIRRTFAGVALGDRQR